MQLTPKQIDELWGETGPYSQVQLIIETRILDNSVSRVFVNVDAQINPLAYKVIKQNRAYFANDEQILQLIDHAKYHGKAYGYVVNSFSQEFVGSDVLEKANIAVEYSKKNVIKIHEFVMDLLDVPQKKK